MKKRELYPEEDHQNSRKGQAAKYEAWGVYN